MDYSRKSYLFLKDIPCYNELWLTVCSFPFF
jgi:hypothetical protein